MRRIYLDTEFTSLNRYTCKLISLALVVPGGPEFYVELTDNWKEVDCSSFVQEVVLPQLDLTTYGSKTEKARVALMDFLKELAPMEIISDAPDWDWPLLVWLAGSGGLPAGVEAGKISRDVETASEVEEPPHHALKDARLLASLVEQPDLAL